jgi:hypothetical protein
MEEAKTYKIRLINTHMVKANTTLGKVAAIAMLPALTFGMFAMPADASYHNKGATTFVGVSNTSVAYTTNMVASGANTGGNIIMGTSASVGGDSGSSAAVSGPVNASSNVDGDVKVKGEGEDKSEVEVEGEVDIDNETTAHGSALSASGNGGSAGKAVTVNTLTTGDAVSEVVIAGAQNRTEIDIAVEDDCACDRYNEYYENASKYYESKYKNEESEYEKDGKYGDIEEEYKLKEGSTVKESDWEVYTKTYVPVKTTIMVENTEVSETVNVVFSGADSGSNFVLGDSVSLGGTSGDSAAVSGPVNASSKVDGDVKADGEGEDKGDVDVEGEVKIDNATHAQGTAGSATGNGGNANDSTTDTLVVTGRAASFVGIIDASKHTIIRIRR